MAQSSFALRGRNPDVLTCIANLSNDEVFTPPELANQMLDAVAEAWAASHDGDFCAGAGAGLAGLVQRPPAPDCTSR